MGLDPDRLSLSGYFEALEAYNAMHDPDAAKGQTRPASGRLKRFVQAHAVND